MRVSLTIMGIVLVAATMALTQTTEDSIVPEIEAIEPEQHGEPKVSAKASLAGSVKGDELQEAQRQFYKAVLLEAHAQGHPLRPATAMKVMNVVHTKAKRLLKKGGMKLLQEKIGEYMEHPERIKDLIKSPAATLVSVKSGSKAKAKTGLLFTAFMIGARIAFHVGIRMAVRIGIRTMARVLARGFTRNTLKMAWKAAKKYIRKKGRKMLKKQAKKQFKKCLKKTCKTDMKDGWGDEEEELYQVAATHRAVMKSDDVSQTTFTSDTSRKLLGGRPRRRWYVRWRETVSGGLF